MMITTRIATIHRITDETDVRVSLDLDGTGETRISTGIGFLDHMLTTLARHSLFDIDIEAKGDLHIDTHHTVEDIGIALGRAFAQAIGNKAGITRFGHALIPLDEALNETVVDISGRPFLSWNVQFTNEKIGFMETELFEEFFRAFAMNAQITLHVTQRAGKNNHHIAETCFKTLARAIRQASHIDNEMAGAIPSTKGTL